MSEAPPIARDVPLLQLLEQIRAGEIQALTFQRPVVLREEWVITLLASVSLGYPIGAVMLLEPDFAAYAIETRPIHGAPPAANGARRLLVDGHHRLAALYQAFTSMEVPVIDESGREVGRSFTLNVSLALDPAADRDHAIRSWRPGTAPAEEFPFSLLTMPESRRDEWRALVAGLPLEQFEGAVLPRIAEFLVPVIHLGPEWTRWTIRVRGGAEGPLLSDALCRK